MRNTQHTSRSMTAMVYALTFFVFWFSALLTPTVALAGGAFTRVDPMEFVLDEANDVDNRVGKALLATGLSGLINATSYFTRKLAYDTAKYVASGGKGQSALVFEEGFGTYLENTVNDSFGEIIAEFSDLTGLNLCQIPDPQFNLFLTFGIRGLYDDVAPTANGCSWTEFRDAWDADAFEARYDRYIQQGENTLDSVLTGEFLNTNRVSQSDFGIAFDAMAQVGAHVADSRDNAEKDRQEGNGFKPLTNLIDGKIRTPASVIELETEKATGKYQQDISAGQIAGIYGSGAAAILPQTIQVFLNTLTSQLVNRLLTEGFLPKGGGSDSGESYIANDPFAAPSGNRRQAAEQAFSFLQTSIPTRDINAYDGELVTQFATCPEHPGVYNCVIDSGLQQAIERARTGDPVTIQEALEAKPPMLFAERGLVPPDRAQTNQSNDCYRNFYCHSNIQKLRKARILPLGFEIATTLGDPDVPTAVTLGDVVGGYNDCAIDADGNEYRDGDHPYCHLIDPNWIIKMPEAICEAVVQSPVLVSPELPDRQQECADLATCTVYNSDGQCVSYGYCLQEENTWQMPGQSCPSEYATCRTFVQQSNGATVSYLNRTVDFGMCDEDSVGCLAYSLYQDADEPWRVSINHSNTLRKNTFLNQTVFLNSRINDPRYTCNPSDVGCTQLEVANIEIDGGTVVSAFPSGVNINLQLAPDYLTCYDKNLNITDGIDWPETIAEAVVAYESNDACADYAPACIAQEVGCHLWTPEYGGTAVPGKVGANTCDSSCKGYDTFRQRETVFEPAIDPMHFIPSYGETCAAQYEGCSEFTNISSPELGGESLQYFTEIRYCEVPTANNEKAFYSWEGSEEEGFVLRVHILAQYPTGDSDSAYYQGVFADVADNALRTELFRDGAPKYAARSAEALRDLYETCNVDSYNDRIKDPLLETAAPAGCREFYDDAGDVYYRMIDQIVSVSDLCVDLRKTNTVLEVDVFLSDEGEAQCNARQGLWEETDPTRAGIECNVCRGGGTYDNGSCIYSTIVSESRSCPSSANQCRSYVGNTGDNIRYVQLGSFDSESTEGWVGGSLSTESPFRDQGSLRIANSASKEVSHTSLSVEALDSAFEIRFWARGVAQQVTASINGQSFGTVSIGDVWREYVLGPIPASSIDTSVDSTVTITGGGVQFFVDNVVLVRTNAYTYLLKHSWQQAVNVDGSVVISDVPLVCDSTPLDPFPGEALGCEQYTNQNGNIATITSFESLCREEAIGCTAVYDTQNNPEETEMWYSAQCHRDRTMVLSIDTAGYVLPGVTVSPDGTCTVNIYDETVTNSAEPVSTESCVIRPEDDFCYIESIAVPAHGFTHIDATAAGDNLEYNAYYNALVQFSKSTYIVAADTPESAPIFVANQPEYRCNDNAIGCTAVGRELQTLPDPTSASSYEFFDQYVRILPAYFVGNERVMCSEDGVGCDAFNSNGGVQYFKDPRITGNTLCEYRNNVLIDGERRDGWFKRGVGLCDDATANVCSTDSDCAAGVSCNTNEPVACYTDYITLDNEYGIWSNNTDGKYDGFVGMCDTRYHMCTEFIDRAATSPSSPEGDKYYTILNDQLTNRVGECEGQVGLKDGCVLFDQTDNPNKVYNTAQSYSDSENNTEEQFGLVPVVTTGVCSGTTNACTTNFDCTGTQTCVGLDSNIVLKVDRDRQCAEWLQCRLSRPEVDENGQTQDVCISYDVCIQANESGTCEVWADAVGAGYCSRDVELTCNDDADCAGVGAGSCVFQQTLTVDAYASRDTSWYGRDYSGYSILNARPYNNFEPVVFDMIDPFRQYLAYRIPESIFAASEMPEKSCRPASGLKDDLERCGLADEGICFEGRCIAPISGRLPAVADLPPIADVDGDNAITEEDRYHEDNAAAYEMAAAAFIAGGCKAYPETDAPFPGSVLFFNTTDDDNYGFGDFANRFKYELVSRKDDFKRVNVYQDPDTFTELYGDVDAYVSSCVYTKLLYQSGHVDYYPINVAPPEGVCGIQSDPQKIGNPCVPGTGALGDGYCSGADNIRGACSPIKEKRTNIGLDGFCLQRDLSTPINGRSDEYACTVWLPMQTSASRVDVYNNHIAAGYLPEPNYDAPNQARLEVARLGPTTEASGGELYCTDQTNIQRPKEMNGSAEYVSGGLITGPRVDHTFNIVYCGGNPYYTHPAGNPNFWDNASCLLAATNYGSVIKYGGGGSISSVYGFFLTGSGTDYLPDNDASGIRVAFYKQDVNYACSSASNSSCSQARSDDAFFATGETPNVSHGTIASGGDKGKNCEDRDANRNSANQRCKYGSGGASTVAGQFQRLVCSPKSYYDATGIVQLSDLMQLWGWSELGAGGAGIDYTTQLLRVEYVGMAPDAAGRYAPRASDEDARSFAASGTCEPGEYIDVVYDEDEDEWVNDITTGNYLTGSGKCWANSLSCSSDDECQGPGTDGRYEVFVNNTCAFPAGADPDDASSVGVCSKTPIDDDTPIACHSDYDCVSPSQLAWGCTPGSSHPAWGECIADVDTCNLNQPLTCNPANYANTAETIPDGHSSNGWGFVYTLDAPQAVRQEVYALVPEVFPASAGNANDKNGAVMMHPPREWNDTPNGNKTIGYTDSSGVITDALSPEVNSRQKELTEVSYLEAMLTQNMIDEVTFVPIRLPGGSAGPVEGAAAPSYFSRELVLDFDSLYNGGNAYAFVNDAVSVAEDMRCVDDSAFPAKKDVPGDPVYGKVYNYKFVRGGGSGCGGLHSSCSYAAGAVDTDSDRNRIETRYALVFTSSENTAFDGASTAATNASNDPFGGNKCSASGHDFIAIGMDFNMRGEFLGYIVRNCVKNSNNDEIGVQLATYAKVRNSCTEFEQVYDPTQIYTGTTNKAKTNVVWRESSQAGLSNTYQPFGSLPLGGGFATSTQRADVVLELEGGAVVSSVVDLYFVKSFRISEKYRLPLLDSDGVDESDANASSYLPPQIYATNPATCVVRSSGALAQSIAGATEGITLGGCTAGPANTMTINGMTGYTTLDFNQDLIPDEDTDEDGIWDGLLGYDTYPVTINFFAFADHDRMPIRNVQIDFMDGSPRVGIQDGYFKNAKPYCGTTIGECGDTQLTCDTTHGTTNNTDCIGAGLTGADTTCTSAKNFGNQSRACTENYFEYSYVYRCYDGIAGVETQPVASLPAPMRQRALRYPNVTDATKVCVFRPRVQITDNWGWCNGSNFNPATGRYDIPRLEGRYGDYACSIDGQSWTPYAQAVYVIPKID